MVYAGSIEDEDALHRLKLTRQLLLMLKDNIGMVYFVVRIDERETSKGLDLGLLEIPIVIIEHFKG
jgi:hypothetical protein